MRFSKSLFTRYADGDFSFPSLPGWASIRQNASCAAGIAAVTNIGSTRQIAWRLQRARGALGHPRLGTARKDLQLRVFRFGRLCGARRFVRPRSDARMARRAVPDGDGKEELKIAVKCVCAGCGVLRHRFARRGKS